MVAQSDRTSIAGGPLFAVGFTTTISVLLATLLTAGCQTTGNPREGGLFGWSEEKARERQSVLESQSETARRTAEDEQRRGEALAKQQAQARDHETAMRDQLRRLLSENDRLEAEVRTLMSRRQLGTAEVARLREALSASEQARASARRGATQVPSPQTTAALTAHADAVSLHNRTLQREVLLLMGR